MLYLKNLTIDEITIDKLPSIFHEFFGKKIYWRKSTNAKEREFFEIKD